MAEKIKLYIVEDYPLARITLQKSLKKYKNLEVAGTYDSAEECLESLKVTPVQIILMDIGLPYMNGIEATKRIKADYADTKVIILTSRNREEDVISSFSSGANAFVLKDLNIDMLYDVIVSVDRGSMWVDPKIRHLADKISK